VSASLVTKYPEFGAHTNLLDMSNSLDISERAERLKGRTLQAMRDFLRRYDVPRDLEKNVMQWIDFDVGHKITHTGNLCMLCVLV
jgi:hypothetical protein